MKKLLMTILMLALVAGVAAAGDEALSGKINSVTVAKDRNGKEYTRIVLPVTLNMNGIDYPKDVLVMGFGDMSAKAKLLKAGDQLYCIGQYREFQGRQSYTLLKILTAEQYAAAKK